jgi:hypothetical protein
MGRFLAALVVGMAIASLARAVNIEEKRNPRVLQAVPPPVIRTIQVVPLAQCPDQATFGNGSQS